MDFEVLPGPSLAELARTALASAVTAEMDDAHFPGDPAHRGRVPVTVPVRDGRDGSPLLLSVTGSVTEHQLAARTEAVTVTVPAAGPYSTLHHLEHGHMADLIGCVRMHGLSRAEWVVARGLDRYGLDLLVLTAHGVAAVRLGFPDGPVASLQDVPASIRTALTCRCESARHGR
jgi:hypothetical protein